MDLAEKIKSFFKGEVHTEAEVLESHSRDASLMKVMPKVVVEGTPNVGHLVNRF